MKSKSSTNMTMPTLLAGINGLSAENTVHRLIPSRASVSEALVFLGALVLVALVFFASTVIFRPRYRRRHSHHYHSKPAPKMDTEYFRRKKTFSYSYRRHRRHSEVFPLNPTLAEVGGLPPVRTRDVSPSMASMA